MGMVEAVREPSALPHGVPFHMVCFPSRDSPGGHDLAQVTLPFTFGGLRTSEFATGCLLLHHVKADTGLVSSNSWQQRLGVIVFTTLGMAVLFVPPKPNNDQNKQTRNQKKENNTKPKTDQNPHPPPPTLTQKEQQQKELDPRTVKLLLPRPGSVWPRFSRAQRAQPVEQRKRSNAAPYHVPSKRRPSPGHPAQRIRVTWLWVKPPVVPLVNIKIGGTWVFIRPKMEA